MEDERIRAAHLQEEARLQDKQIREEESGTPEHERIRNKIRSRAQEQREKIEEEARLKAIAARLKSTEVRRKVAEAKLRLKENIDSIKREFEQRARETKSKPEDEIRRRGRKALDYIRGKDKADEKDRQSIRIARE